MALNIKDPETERLAAEVATLAGETKTRAINVALQERWARLAAARTANDRTARLLRFLTDEAWPQVPAALLGKAPTRADREEILGYGPEGG
ncbi:MAG TPA: type II toxin-antitoxin system VapB family antitoxin [Micromonosporaceae bacterium]|jgi:antitoxin VapB